MSSFTSLTVNKNSTRFAPKVKSRNKRSTQQATDLLSGDTNVLSPKQSTDSDPAAQSSSATAINTAIDVIDSSIDLDTTTAINQTDTHSSLQVSSLSTISEISETRPRRPSRTKRASAVIGTPIVPGSSSSSSSSTVTATTSRSAVRAISQTSSTAFERHSTRKPPQIIPEPPTPVTTPTPPVPSSSLTAYVDDDSDYYALNAESPTIISTVPFDDLTASPESVAPRIESVNPSPLSTTLSVSSNTVRISQSKARQVSGNSFAAPSNEQPKFISRLMSSMEDDNPFKEDQVNDRQDDESNTTKPVATKRKRGNRVMTDTGDTTASSENKTVKMRRERKVLLLAKDMKTLDDISSDPLRPEDLDRPMSYFIKDLPRGVVTKQFRDEQLKKEDSLFRRQEEKAVKTNDVEAIEALKKQKEELQQLQKQEQLRQENQKLLEDEQHNQKQQALNGLAESSHSLQVRLVNGKIVLDTDSMLIDRGREHEGVSHEHMEIVEETATSRKVNSATYSKKEKSSRWSKEETELFYDLVSQFGTDFEMMAQLMPKRTRLQLRSKFKKEERTNPDKITHYMIKKRKPLDLEYYKEVTGLKFEAVPEHFHSLQLA